MAEAVVRPVRRDKVADEFGIEERNCLVPSSAPVKKESSVILVQSAVLIV